MMTASPAEWIFFGILVVSLLAMDLYHAHRHPGRMSMRSAVIQTVIWISVAVLFGILVIYLHGPHAGMEYYASYLIEKAMSVDNLFVFILLFSMFSIPEEYQHKALFYGVFGAIVFRAVFVFAGSALLESMDFMMYVFGILLLIIALKTLREKGSERSPVADWLSRHLRISESLDGDRFTTTVNGARIATPLLACVIAIEFTDIIFAIDSVPACLAITSDVFIVYTSNIFAVLGLRSLYFVIHGSLESLRYMRFGLAAILAFIGLKMLAADYVHMDAVTSLMVIVIILAVTIAASLYGSRRARQG
ncbi:MAG: TerC/Alx family metal homeostasis membrane protein [Candidatus Methanomethylophilaceae archaeon]